MHLPRLSKCRPTCASLSSRPVLCGLSRRICKRMQQIKRERPRFSDFKDIIAAAMSSAGTRLKCIQAQASKSARKVPTRSALGSQPQRVSLEVRAPTA